MNQDAIDAATNKRESSLIELRRDIHRHPEIAGGERRTAGLVAQALRAAGLEVRTGVGGHGVVGILEGSRGGRTVAYRADMDAVRPEDQFGGGTENAHLCGHDLHTTIGVGVAEVLAGLRHQLAGTIVFVFQPAEEALTGAAAMLADDVFGDASPSEIHALHCGPFPVGEFVVMPGYGMPGQDYGVITVIGAGAVSRAQEIATEVDALGTTAPPTTPATLEQFLVDAQTPDGPLREFVFMQAGVSDSSTAERAHVKVAYRCWPEERYVELRETIRRLAGSIAGTTVAFAGEPSPAMKCPPHEANAVKRHLQHTFGSDRVGTLHAAIPFSGEDFALFFDRLPGTYSFLGVRAPGAGIETSYPHFGTFTPDERAIGVGVRAMAGWLASRARP
ncbi:M20 metallopeptidase family protein [Flindersiella endophytica]